MLRSKRRSDLVVCFVRIDEPLRSSGLHSFRASQVPKQLVPYLLRGAPFLAHSMAGVALSELNLGRESGCIYPRNREFS